MKTKTCRDVLQSLVADIEAMYQGQQEIIEGGDREEFFGPFQWAKDSDGNLIEANTEISWPNLAILLEEAREVLKAESL